MLKNKFFVKTKSILFNRLKSILLKVLRRVYLSLVNNGQWRKNGLWIQYRDHSCIKDLRILRNCLNLCSLKWLKSRRSRVISLVPLGLWQLYTELAAGLINYRIFLLNIRKLSTFMLSTVSPSKEDLSRQYQLFNLTLTLPPQFRTKRKN